MPYSDKAKTPLKDKILITIFSVIILVSVLLVAGVFLMNTRFLKSPDTNSGNGLLDELITTPDEIKEKCVNFLVVGVANYDNDNGYRGSLTDVIMVVNFDVESEKVNVLQIPRDTFVGDASNDGKINSIYGMNNGGIDGLATEINSMLNLTIDHYITLNMSAFISIVDKIGGVEVNVPTRIDLEGTIIEPGLQTLDGYTAEKFVRERKSYATQDIMRLEMQQLFMKALIDKVFTMDYKEMAGLVPTLLSDVTTDLTINNVLGYYKEVMDVDTTNGINFHMLPITEARSNGLSFLSVKRLPTADLLNQYFRPYTPDVLAEDLYGIIELVSDYPYEKPITVTE